MNGDSSEDGSARARLVRHALHDLANVLTCILAAASHRTADGQEAQRHLSAIATAAELGRELLIALRVGAPVSGSGAPTRLTTVLGSAGVLLRCVAQPSGVTVAIDLEDVAVSLPAHQLQEIVFNLGLNAIEAMPEGGQLHLSASSRDDRVRIAIRDTGGGVEPDLLLNMVSTKGPGRGAGLTSVVRILQRVGGMIDLTSDHAGTCFVIDLPKA